MLQCSFRHILVFAPAWLVTNSGTPLSPLVTDILAFASYSDGQGTLMPEGTRTPVSWVRGLDPFLKPWRGSFLELSKVCYPTSSAEPVKIKGSALDCRQPETLCIKPWLSASGCARHGPWKKKKKVHFWEAQHGNGLASLIAQPKVQLDRNKVHLPQFAPPSMSQLFPARSQSLLKIWWRMLPSLSQSLKKCKARGLFSIPVALQSLTKSPLMGWWREHTLHHCINHSLCFPPPGTIHRITLVL